MKKPSIYMLNMTCCGLGLLLAGCSTPDLKPFADSTASLHLAMTQNGDIIHSELSVLKKAQVIDDKSIQARADTIPAALDARVAFMEAVVKYSDSLAAVADAGKNGAANAKSLSDSVSQLAGMIGPYGAAVGGVGQIIAQGYGEASQAWAVHSLKEATAKANPIIQDAAKIMMVDMTNVVSVLDRGGRGLIAKNDDPYLDDYGVRSKLLKYRKNKIADINNTITETNYEQLLAKYNKDNAETETTIKTLNDLLDPLDAKDAEIHQRFDQEEDMARNTLKAFQQWAAVHADLTKALKEDRQPNIRELASTVLEIKSEIENLKKH